MQRRWQVRGGDDLGAAVAELRRARGLTQAQLAEQSGLGRPWLAKLENGRTAVVLDHLLRLLRRLGATVVIIWDEPDDQGGDQPVAGTAPSGSAEATR